MAEPKCPSCNIQGIDKIVSCKSAQQSKDGHALFDVVHCDSCGHVYGVFTRHVLSHEMEMVRVQQVPSLPPMPSVP